jgi:flagellar protein FliS
MRMEAEVMLPNNKAYDQYTRSKILTASPAELTLMLYDGAIKFCNIAMSAMESKDYNKVNIYIKKAENIIEEFQATLNHKYTVAEDFDKIYAYIYGLLVDANIHKDPEVLKKATDEIRGMRDTWKEVMKRAGSGTKDSFNA